MSCYDARVEALIISYQDDHITSLALADPPLRERDHPTGWLPTSRSARRGDTASAGGLPAQRLEYRGSHTEHRDRGERPSELACLPE